MFGVHQILVSRRARALALAASVVALLAACGQKGPLFLPTGEAAVGRAPLLDTISPSTSVSTPARAASATPPTGTAVPAPRP